MRSVSLVPSKPRWDLSRYPLGLRLQASYPGILCESGLVGVDPPVNHVPEFVAFDPKLRDTGNRLVKVYPALDFIWLLGVYFLPCV
jgi:hypothetical protein